MKQDMEKTFEQLQKSEKRFKLAMGFIFLIISFAAVMIIISILSSV
jgi:hypothetical protein